MTEITQEIVDREKRKSESEFALLRLSGILGAVIYLIGDERRDEPHYEDFVLALSQMRESIDNIYSMVEAI